MLLQLWRMCKNVFSWRPQATKCQKCMVAILFSQNMMKIHIEATEMPHCTFSDRARRNSLVFVWFFVFFNMAKFCQILTLFAQVMTSGANYGGYIRYRP